jgi:hypothetical protein
MTDLATAAAVDPGAAPAASAPAAVTSQPAAPTNGQGSPWFAGAGYTDDDRVFMENKGWTKQETPIAPVALKSYRELERIMGAKANAVILPQSGDEKGVTELFQKLGMPEAADKYALPQGVDPNSFDPDVLKSYQAIAHSAKMTNDQFGTAVKLLNEATAKAEEQATVRFNADVGRTKEKLSAEFGNTYPEQVARGNLAMRTLGISVDDMADLSEAIGVEKATRMLMKVGGLLASHKAVGLDNSGKPPDGFVTDKARASSEIQKVKMGGNPQFQKALLDPQHPEHQNVNAQWREWNRVAGSK